MTTTMPPVEITASTPGDYPFGVFSVAPTTPPAGSQWTAGVWWRTTAGQQVGVTYAPCQVDDEVPVTLDANVDCAIGTARAFTVYARSDEAVGGGDLPAKFARAREVLQGGEQYAVEAALWALMMDATPSAAGDAASYAEAVAMAEGRLSQVYGGPATLHASRYVAGMLGGTILHADGARLRTVLNAHLIAGGGYSPAPTATDPAASVIATGPVIVMRGEVMDLGQHIDRDVNNISAVVERTYVVGWDGPAVRIAVA